MSLNLSKPILYLITPGATDETTTQSSRGFQNILHQVSAAVAAGIQLVQLREKKLTARVLFELTERAVEIARGSSTHVLVNDRADIAAGAGAAGVHLTTSSLEADIVRKTFGPNFMIGVSTHSVEEARSARDSGADFVVFGPIFPTLSKEEFGPPIGVNKLAEVASELAPFPVVALGGVSTRNAPECFQVGASGIAGISLFSEPESFQTIAASIKQSAKES